jgi:outer membrane protein OmpA-like peptidoglycan-associated protein
MKHYLFILLALFLPLRAGANICGTDYQAFNPTTNGLDFVTVQSSETLRPCVINMGLFFNYAVNSLTYSKSLATLQSGQQRQDRIFGADLSAGFGLTDRWDFGVNMPFILNQTIKDDYYVSSFKETGATEVKANTKYKFLGDENGGLAGILSVNKNLIKNNPFAGTDPGLTWNFELAADTVIASKWAAAVNLGYRLRSPGDAIPNLPFVPMEDQWIYSLAGSYLFTEYDTKVIFELYGSRAAESMDSDADRNLNSLEGLAGVKYDYSDALALHVGMAKQIDASLGGAEWRVYAGLNWALGPVCKTNVFDFIPARENEPEVYTLDVQLAFGHNEDTIPDDKLATVEAGFKDAFNHKFSRVSVEGHTDSVGDAAYNQDLSQRRANFVRKHLMKKYQIQATKIEAIGYGETKPIADNGNYQGRRKNRRVEIKIWR